MALACGLLAFGLPGHSEWLLLLVIGLLLFGRRLPEVGRSLGRTLTEFRRGLQNFKREMDADPDLREAKSAVKDIHRTLRAPAELSNPKRLFDRLTDDSQVSAGPDSSFTPPPPTRSRTRT